MDDTDTGLIPGGVVVRQQGKATIWGFSYLCVKKKKYHIHIRGSVCGIGEAELGVAVQAKPFSQGNRLLMVHKDHHHLTGIEEPFKVCHAII